MPPHANEETTADHAFQQLSWDQLYGLFASFAPREAMVLRFRFGLLDGRSHTLEEVGKRFGVPAEQMRQIEKRALERLYRSGDTGKRQGSLV